MFTAARVLLLASVVSATPLHAAAQRDAAAVKKRDVLDVRGLAPLQVAAVRGHQAAAARLLQQHHALAARADAQGNLTCANCGLNQKTSALSCCHTLGSWLNRCAKLGKTNASHPYTWRQGVKACQGRAKPQIGAMSRPGFSSCPWNESALPLVDATKSGQPQDHWDLYRLADSWSEVTHSGCGNYSDSIACVYRQLKTRHQDAAALAEATLKHTLTWPRAVRHGPRTLVWHLRLGDVVYYPDCFSDEPYRCRCRCNFAQKHTYVLPRAYFDAVLGWLDPHAIDQVVLVTSWRHQDRWTDQRNTARSPRAAVAPTSPACNSIKYLHDVVAYFGARGLSVTAMASLNPDDDFALMCQSHNLVLSGGGFGAAAAMCRRAAGLRGRVIAPSGFLYDHARRLYPLPVNETTFIDICTGPWCMPRMQTSATPGVVVGGMRRALDAQDYVRRTAPMNASLVVVGAHHFGSDENDPIYSAVADVAWSDVLLVEANPSVAAELRAAVAKRNPMSAVASHRVRVVNQGVCPVEGDQELPFYTFAGAPGLPYWATQFSSFHGRHVTKHLGVVVKRQEKGYNYTFEGLKKQVVVKKVLCTSLLSLLRRVGIWRLGVLLIDTEGLDCALVASQDWASHTWCGSSLNPMSIIFETKHCTKRAIAALERRGRCHVQRRDAERVLPFRMIARTAENAFFSRA